MVLANLVTKNFANMIWQPLNLTSECPAHTELTVCSHIGYVYLNLLVRLYAGSRDKRIQEKLRNEGIEYEEKILDDLYKYEDDIEEEEYDFIVVGAGSAGCVVANRLTEEKQWKVLLLEAGPEQPDISLVPGLSEGMLGSNVDWNYSPQPDPRSCLKRTNGRCAWSRGKMMGGSSSINTMVYVRGNPVDFDGWAAMGNRGWSYKDVLPYFKKSEKNLNIESLDHRFHGNHGPQSIARYPYIDSPSIALTTAFNELGLPMIDFNGPQQVSTLQSQAFSEDGIRVSTNNGYIEPIRYKRKNLTVKPNAEVFQILINKHKRAYGVQYMRNGKVYTVKAKKDVIVSGGVINSPKLLLLSGIGPKKHLDDINIPVVQNLPVGDNLHDHVTFTGIVVVFDNKTSALVDYDEMLKHVKEYSEMDMKRGPLSSSGPYNSVSFFKTDESLPAPDIQIQTYNYILKEYLKDPVTYETLKLFPTVFYDSLSIRVQNLVPKSRGRLILNATDPNGPPIMYANYLADRRDYEPVKKGVKILTNLEKTETFKSGRARFLKIKLPPCEHTVWGSYEYSDCMLTHYTFALSHQVGTCKMGAEWDNTAVVDPRLRVYGISGLRVIDASIIPVVVRGNINAPAIMIGEKGADMIKEDWLHNYVPDYEHDGHRDKD